MDVSAARAWNGLDLDGMGVRPLREKDLETIAAGMSPAMAGFAMSLGFIGLVAAGVAVGVAVYYFTH